MPSAAARIVVTGFSGTGKTIVSRLVAAKLGWDAVDTDTLIEHGAGKPVAEIFRDDGEAQFRDLETDALREACSRERVVVSTGGGAVLGEENRRLMADGAFVVCLEARPETIAKRLGEGAGSEPVRPLLAGGDALSPIRELKTSRQALYALADWTVHTDELAPEQVASVAVEAYEHLACVVRTAGGSYPVFVEWGALASLGSRLRDAGLARQVYVISDEQVWHHLGDEVEAALRAAEIVFDMYVIPPGEASKTLESASAIYDWLVQHRAERGHTIVAAGGGVVTDLAGFVAATFARGLPLVHVPTSLLGMVDAAIGGKTAVNHPKSKNVIGAFYQPRFVLADPAALRTAPPRELSGWAEAIKHALIANESYLSFFEENAERIMRLERDVTVEAIRRSAAIKATIVSEDERETTGLRAVLNYGHTLAHAIESTTGYSRFRHGEADGIGMMAAAGISVRMGLLEQAVVERQRMVLERFKLPTRAEGLDRERIREAIALDKKVQGKAVRWVLLEGIGRPVVRDDVPPDVVEAALDEVLG